MLTWEAFEDCLHECRRCKLAVERGNIVPGEGNREARVLFVGEGPGQDEDMQGRPFVGKAGQLLDKILASVGFDREIVYIANIVKCRPPGNRVPEPDEVRACLEYLRMQFALIHPNIIVCLGATAAKAIIREDFRITRERGVWYEKNGIHIIATYHPAALLRDEMKKKDTWHDMQSIRARYDEITGERNNAEGNS